MIKTKKLKILKTTTCLWPTSSNGYSRTKGIIDGNGEYYGAWTDSIRFYRSFIDLLRGDMAITHDDEDYPVSTIEYLGIHHMKSLGESVAVKIYVINHRSVYFNRVGWAHFEEANEVIPLSIFRGDIKNIEIFEGLQLIINEKYKYDMLEEVTKDKEKKKSIWYSKSTDKRLMCIDGKFDQEELYQLFEK